MKRALGSALPVALALLALAWLAHGAWALLRGFRASLVPNALSSGLVQPGAMLVLAAGALLLAARAAGWTPGPRTRRALVAGAFALAAAVALAFLAGQPWRGTPGSPAAALLVTLGAALASTRRRLAWAPLAAGWALHVGLALATDSDTPVVLVSYAAPAALALAPVAVWAWPRLTTPARRAGSPTAPAPR